MAEKRMLTKKIIESDAFMELPLTAQALYMHLVLNADDEGFMNNSKSIQRLIGASADDMQALIDANFIIKFEDSGVIVIKHWKMHNKVQPSRLVKTQYTEEKAQLSEKSNESYTLSTNCRQIVDKMSTDCQQNVAESSIGKIRLVKDSSSSNNININNINRPTLDEVKSYIREHNLGFKAEDFYNYYNNCDWKTVKGEQITNWKSALVNWSKREKPKKMLEHNHNKDIYNEILAIRGNNDKSIKYGFNRYNVYKPQ